LRHRVVAPLFAALAMLALAVNLLVPPGYMVAGARVILCTGYGPVAVTFDADGMPHKAPVDSRSDHQPLCGFAGHLAPLVPLLAAPAVLVRFAVAQLPLAALSAGLAPGRGMAAPPPPSHAPPQS
jgi:hypothetical protein